MSVHDFPPKREHHNSALREPAHGHHLADDLPLIAAQLLQRRKALAWLGASAAGSALTLAGCGGGGSGGGSLTSAATTTAASTTAAATTASTSSSSGSTSTTTTTSTSSSSCTAVAGETAGPYPADGTNTSSGATSDVLTASGIVRSDIRSSFISSTTQAQGVLTTLTLTLVNTNSSCAPLSGYAIYLWHCDRDGNYSLYTAAAESYLRGVQVTDANGQVTFTTIFPGCYSGRWPHIHFEVFASQAAATTGRNAVLTSQLALPSAACSAVYPYATGYTSSVNNFANVSLTTDNVFSDNTAAQLAAMTPAMSGSVSAGYTGTATIGIAR
ncbi:intradiol ring-cleavage dioxygenase [Variovorax sp. WS11]|uniref:dioxygenase family protein n=1 Tax=Variovorax sp. WS11 TaxID=1105204 RepID=UPI000D0E1A7C|nr:intradiol ring-cleavage dioxygenase [Variovorax sp. WS11]NDZ14639.1 intradiol ring-cleavage dioxygenase [Variovorax sp. WS11]PSL79935.1 intradiol ring-cleavage dioxygenase [Variovorax sp. WS11]